MERIPNMQSLGFGNVNCGNVRNSYNETIPVNKADDEGDRIRQWLSPLDPGYRHRSLRANRVNGVGGWLLERKEFREWSGNQGIPEQTVLFCYGDPGVGKTHIKSVTKLSPTSGYH